MFATNKQRRAHFSLPPRPVITSSLSLSLAHLTYSLSPHHKHDGAIFAARDTPPSSASERERIAIQIPGKIPPSV
jgi:hypothetical protein